MDLNGFNILKDSIFNLMESQLEKLSIATQSINSRIDKLEKQINLLNNKFQESVNNNENKIKQEFEKFSTIIEKKIEKRFKKQYKFLEEIMELLHMYFNNQEKGELKPDERFELNQIKSQLSNRDNLYKKLRQVPVSSIL